MIQCPRGTRDFLPDEMEKRRFYENRLRHVARTFGFREVETPIFEEAELFILRSGPNVLNELYAFKDKGDRDIALRPEMTAPAIRMFVNGMSNDPKPIKIFYFGQCFRYERPQSGRYREFFQFGAELIGSATPQTDAEVIAMASSMIENLGLREYKLRIGHIGVLRQKIADAGVPKERAAEVLQKLDKKLYDEARPLLSEMGVSESAMEDIFDLTETVGGVEVLDKVPGEAGDWLRQVVSYLDAMGVPTPEIDLGVVRGLDYYTGMVFEAEAPALGAEKQICGGGSYTLSQLFGGEEVFSTGFAIGFDRILLAMEKEGQTYEPVGIDAYVVPVTDDMRMKSAEILAMLRRSGISSDMDIMGRKMAKAMKYASGARARYVVIVGAKELEEGSVTLRDMASGEQTLVKIDALAQAIKGRSVPVHLGVQERIRARDQLLRPADVPVAHLGYLGGQGLRVLVEVPYAFGLHLVFAAHLLDHEFRIHHEFGFGTAQLYDLGDRRYEPAVLGIVVGVHAEELCMFVDYLPVLGDDDGVGGFSRVPSGPSVGIYSEHRYSSSLDTLLSPSTRRTLALMGASTSS